MDHSQPQHHQNVQEVLKKWPQTAHAFAALSTSCVGCYLAPFCTLKEVAGTYKLGLDLLLEKLKEVIHDPNPRSNTNESN